jgi:hypothetical protein
VAAVAVAAVVVLFHPVGEELLVPSLYVSAFLN